MPRPAKPISDQHLDAAEEMLERGLTHDQASWDVSALRGARNARGRRRQELMVSATQLRRELKARTKTDLHQNAAGAQGDARTKSALEVEAQRTEPQAAGQEGQ